MINNGTSMEDTMKVVIYFSMSRKKRSKGIAMSIEGDHYELRPGERIGRIPIISYLRLGFITMKDKDVPVEAPEIDFDKYDEVVLVFPIWAARMAQYMKCYLNQVPFKSKKVKLIATSNSGQKGYMNGLGDSVDPSNDVIDITMYKRDVLQHGVQPV